MTRARNVSVADRCKPESTCPIGVYGPTRNTRSSPTTSGGRSRLASTPVSHTRGKGNAPRASAQASGVPSRTRTPSVTAPDWTDKISGSKAPGALRELVIACHDRCVSSAMTGPSSAIQMRPVPARASDLLTERSVRGTATPPGPPPLGAGGVTIAGSALAAKLIPDRGGNGAGRAGQRRRQERISTLLCVERAASRRQHVGDERVARRRVLRAADRGDVQDQRRSGLGYLASGTCDRDRRLRILVGHRRLAEVNVRRQADVVQ